MGAKQRSNITFFVLIAILVVAAGLNSFLPQGNVGALLPQTAIPKWQLALGSAGITALLYGALGFVGLILWRKLGYPDIWDEKVTNRQRFLIPALVGAVLGLGLIIVDLLFSRFNGIGRLIHPPFPTSLVASLSAGIGEEMLFRLFFISFWTWLIGKLILRGRGQSVVYWVVSIIAAFAFSASHLPTVMIITGAGDPGQLSPVLLAEILLINVPIGLCAAYFFKKFGFLAPVGIHFWTDIVWHMLWGLF